MALNVSDELKETLNTELLSALEDGIQSEQTGGEYTWEEAKQFARERRTAWTNVPDSLSA